MLHYKEKNQMQHNILDVGDQIAFAESCTERREYFKKNNSMNVLDNEVSTLFEVSGRTIKN